MHGYLHCKTRGCSSETHPCASYLWLSLSKSGSLSLWKYYKNGGCIYLGQRYFYGNTTFSYASNYIKLHQVTSSDSLSVSLCRRSCLNPTASFPVWLDSSTPISTYIPSCLNCVVFCMLLLHATSPSSRPFQKNYSRPLKREPKKYSQWLQTLAVLSIRSAE